jgi:AraC-like DNA-binding protein
MNQQLLDELKEITEEEQLYQQGMSGVNAELYMDPESHVVDYKRLVESGKTIQIRTHTRFVHFPEHTHNYVELIYMCTGSTTHIVNGDTIHLQTGELLFLNQNARQEIYPAGRDDIAINFIILPAFFDYSLTMIGEEDNPVRKFLLDCLKSKESDISYLHFQVAEVLPIQNLMENLIWTLHNRQNFNRSIQQATMGVLLMHLMNYMDRARVGSGKEDQELTMSILRYVEDNYRDGELGELAGMLHYDLPWLSRRIKELTGRNYTRLVQEKRMRQAAYLLQVSQLTVAEVAEAVGYENISYFHRLFQKTYGCSPRSYRCQVRNGMTGGTNRME